MNTPVNSTTRGYRRALPTVASVAAATLLAACQHSAAPPAPPPQQIEKGFRFSLDTPLSFPGGQPRMLFQNLKVVPVTALAPYEPYCSLTAEKDAALIIPPITLIVQSVNYDERAIAGTQRMTSVTRIALAAPVGTSAYVLRCGWPEGAPQAAFLSADQIFNAIGNTFTMDQPR
ncbi:hypothetical protein [Accumulibacter sp.]|uniref:hypothetical protein n=1 Tax=Accumulibacter sp. TaxID=2053492 RepID=UPI0028C3A6D0|nr:hypothetical protein [Accumulibacter sp.]